MNCNNYMNQSYEGLANLALGSAYVPFQHFEQVLDADNALIYGSVFAELVKPFYSKKAACCEMGGKNG